MHELEREAAELLRDAREEIDRIDSEMVALLARRKELVSKVAETKTKHGLPIYLPGREQALIEARRQEADEAGVSPGLIEDVLRRIMRESYDAEGLTGFKPTQENPKPVVLVGGRSGMCRLMGQFFEASGYPIRVLDEDDWDNAEALLKDAGLVLIGVPISATVDVIKRLRGFVDHDCILADVTSIKATPLAKMLQYHENPIVGLHPMFGNDTRALARQVIVVCHGRRPREYSWLLDQLRLWGATLLPSDPFEHDHMMAIIQALRHFETFVYGVHLCREEINLDQVLEFSSPIYRMEVGMVGRLFAQAPKLYADIIFSSAEGKGLIRRYLKRFNEMMKLLDDDDKEGFIREFNTVKDWLGDLADRFREESKHMIEKSVERRGAGAPKLQ